MPATSPSQPSSQHDLVRTLRAISTALNLKQPLPTTLDLIAEQVARTLGHRYCAIALHQRGAGAFRISGSYGLSQEYLDAANALLSDQIARDGLDGAQSITLRAFRSRMPLQVNDITTDPAFQEWRQIAGIVGYTSAVFLPLIFRGEPIGALSCYDHERTYDAEDIDALQIVAEQTATAVGIAELLDNQQHAIDKLQQTTEELDDRNRMLRLTAAATRTLTDLLLKRCTLEELLTELHRHLDSPIILFDDGMRPLAAAGTDTWEPAPDAIVVAVDSADMTYGHLAVGTDTNGARKMRDPLLEQAAMACALYFMREQAAEERELRLTSQVLNDLLTGDNPDRDAATLETRLRLDKNSAYRIVTVVPTRGPTTDTTSSRQRIRAMTAALRRFSDSAGRASSSVYALPGTILVAIVPAAAPEQLAELTWQVLADDRGPDDLQVGVSRVCMHASDYNRRYRELQKCLELAGQANPVMHTVIAERWHVHTMLMRTTDDVDVRDRAHQLLDPVLANGNDPLLTSVRTHLESHASVTRTATALHVHPNTVKYRLRKLEMLTGLDVRDLQHLIELQVAIAVHDLDPARFAAEARFSAT